MEKITEQFLFYEPLPESTNCQDILDVVDNDYSSHYLSRKYCISICTNGSSSMLGNLKWFVALAKKKNSGIVFTHCFLHREALSSKSIVQEDRKVLEETQKVVNYIKSTPLHSRLFSAVFCHGCYSHATPTAHGSAVVIWGRVLSRFNELREELIICFTSEESELADLLSDEAWWK
jgi:hypothetical protein